MPFTITDDALHHLSRLDPVMGRLIKHSPVPKEPTIDDPFVALIDTVIGQQISEHVKAILMERLKDSVGDLTPENIKQLDKKTIHRLGVSKMKAETMILLANNKETINTLKGKDPKTIRGILKSFKGIGDWTIDMFFFVCLEDPHILSLKDMGIRNALKRLYDATDEDMEHFKDYFHPYESTAACYLWQSLSMVPEHLKTIKEGDKT